MRPLYTCFLLIISSCAFAQDWQQRLLERIETNNPPRWMQEQVTLDLQAFQSGITPSMLDPVDEFDLARFIIKNNKVTAKALSFTVDFLDQRMEKVKRELVALSKVVRLPDMIMLVDLSDGYSGGARSTRPIFVFSKDSRDMNQGILIPDCEVLRAGRNLPEMITIENKKIPWSQKIAKAFWRGSSTGFYFPIFNQVMNFYCTVERIQAIPRFKLIEYSKLFPDKLDASFTRINKACARNEDVMTFLQDKGFMSPSVSIADHLPYKYQILIDGTTSAWQRAYWQLWSNCAMLKQESFNIQWYYRGLIPCIHYIPFAYDSSNLIRVITWAQENDERVHQIAKNGKQFARENLTYGDMMYYLYYVLQEYAKLQRFTPAQHQDVGARIVASFSIH